MLKESSPWCLDLLSWCILVTGAGAENRSEAIRFGLVSLDLELETLLVSLMSDPGDDLPLDMDGSESLLTLQTLNTGSKMVKCNTTLTTYSDLG